MFSYLRVYDLRLAHDQSQTSWRDPSATSVQRVYVCMCTSLHDLHRGAGLCIMIAKAADFTARSSIQNVRRKLIIAQRMNIKTVPVYR